MRRNINTENMSKSNILIQDKITKEFYCVPMTSKDRYGNATTGYNDFPYWSTSISEACKFDSELLARHETNMNDLTEDGKRQPHVVII